MATNYYIHYITHEGTRPAEALPAREGATLSQAIKESRELAYANCLCGSSAVWQVIAENGDGCREIVADGPVALTATGRKMRVAIPKTGRYFPPSLIRRGKEARN